MRQAGIIAAAALHALDHHVERLADDHAHAQILAKAVDDTEGLALESGPVETNLVWISVDPRVGERSRRRDLSSLARNSGQCARSPSPAGACTHLDASREHVEYAASVIRGIEPALISAMTLVY